MQILIDGTVFQKHATGIAKATLGLYKACTEKGENLQVGVLHRTELMVDLPEDFTSIRIGRNLPPQVWRNFLVPMHLLKRRPAAIHFPCNGNVPRISALTPAITTYHDVLPLIIPGYFKSEKSEHIFRKRVQRDIDRTDLLITDSVYSANEIMKNFKVEKEPTVIYLAPFLDSSKAQSPLNGKYFLYVGGFNKRKGIEPMLDTFLGLKKEGLIESKLVIVGKREHVSDKLDRLIECGEEMGAVETPGYVSDSELSGLYSGAVALVYPSKYEGFGLPPIEAMSAGCPVITTRFTSIPEICGDAVVYADPDKEGELAECMMALENNIEFRSGLIEKGKLQVMRYSWSKAAEKFLEKVTELFCNYSLNI